MGLVIFVENNGRVNTCCFDSSSIRHTASSRAGLCPQSSESAVILQANAFRKIGTELEVLGVLFEMVCADRTLDVEGLRHVWVIQQLIFLQGVTDQRRFLKVHAVFTVGALAPSAAIEHATRVLSALMTIEASMLRAIELPTFGLGTVLQVKAFEMISSRAQLAAVQLSAVKANLAVRLRLDCRLFFALSFCETWIFTCHSWNCNPLLAVHGLL